VSKHWKPGKKTVELAPAARPSRIRRDPPPVERKVEPRTDEEEVWFGVAGVLLIAAVLAALTVGIGVATFSRYDPSAAAANAAQFDQCYNSDGPNCVLDGDTIYVAGEKVQIAGMEAPKIQGAQCDGERSRGISAAVQLADLLNSGRVTVSGTFRDPYGRDVRKVQVNGQDAGKAMIDAGVARRYNGKQKAWC
jgi:micrococcal nuclease